MFITIADHQRGIEYRNGNICKLLTPGKYFKPFNQKIEIFDITKRFLPPGDLAVYQKNTDITEQLHVITVLNNQIVLHFEEEIFTEVLPVGKYAFWKALKNHKFITIDTNNPYPDQQIDQSYIPKLINERFLQKFKVERHDCGLLYINNTFQKKLEPGIYYFWIGPNEITVINIDLRQQQLDVAGQDIMSKDKVTLRLNCVCHYKIVNPEKLWNEIKEYDKQLYILVQLALREYIGTLTFDEILQKKEEIGPFILESVKQQSATLGIEMLFTGIKDIILPGDVKEIINQVLIAEKKAQANVIMRREETASTRSLLNTAKLMEENQLLYKLKELEYIERISEKISQIQLSNGGQILDQLKQLFIK